jgi:putative peptidoglycan lipid II flippase
MAELVKEDVKPVAAPRERRPPRTTGGALLVGAGIFLSRITGLIRDRVFAHYFGNTDAADAFKAAQKIPNFLQNLFGEGVLSASFIPVYARLLGERDRQKADRVACAIGSLLGLLVSGLVVVGVLTTPWFIDLVAPGFEGAKRELTIRLVQILFPGVGLLVMSAWCLGILNSHRRFFLSYASPVVSNAAMIAVMIGWGRCEQAALVRIAAWGLVAGNLLQFAIQLPTVRRLVADLRPVWDVASQEVRTIIHNFFPVVLARGVVQVSAYVDNMLASLLPTGAVSALAYAQTLYLLPVSLFGMSVSAAELPAMSGVSGSAEEVSQRLRQRLDAGLRQIAFFIVPSMAAFLAFGNVIVAAIYQTGAFGAKDTRYVWAVLAGSTIGLLASTLGRLYSSTHYALRDTRRPLKFAIVRVVLTTVLGYTCALLIPRLLHIGSEWGTVGLTASAGVAGWIEFLLLRRSMNGHIGRTGMPGSYIAKLWLAALVATATGLAVEYVIGTRSPLIVGLVVLAPYGVVYLLLAAVMRIPEAQAVMRRLPGIRARST